MNLPSIAVTFWVNPLRRLPDYDFRFVLEDRGLLLRVAGTRAIVLPVEWAFGAGDQAVTFGEAAKGVPPPIKVWYPQDESLGRGFIY